jgi:MYXO-CTERM domain-containing protein
MKKLILVLSFPALCLPATALAHFNLVAPPPSSTTTDGGMGSPPCGGGTASGVVTPAQGGHPIMVQVDEFVAHTGFYRIALALKSTSELPVDNVVKDAMGNILPPSGKPAGTSATAIIGTSILFDPNGTPNPDPAPVFPVLGDGVFWHKANGEQTLQMNITLPNVSCDKCTLQVIEFMYDHGFNFSTPPAAPPGGGYFYHHCADLKITADPSLPPFVAGGAGGSSAGGSSGMSGGSGGSTSSGGGAVGTGGGVASQGGAPGSAGASAGGAPAGTGGTAVTGTSGAGVAGSAAMDNGGCSCSLGKGSAARESLVALLFGLVAVGLRRRRRVSERGA